MKYIVIVDAYSAGNLLAKEFKTRGYSCLHVQSTEEIWPILRPSFFPEDFVLNLPFLGNVENIVQQISAYEPKAVLAGTETGVELADTLAEKLGLPGNGSELSLARRNKFAMIATADVAGLSVAKQIKALSAKDVITWQRENDLNKIVIKPINSAGTDNVFICTSTEQIETACEKIIGKTNKLGLHNDDVLAQEFLEGTEFFLNTISDKGKHFFTEIWQYQKRQLNGHDCVYDNNKLLPYDGEVQEQLRSYAEKVLDCLNIQFGPAHMEVMLTKTGPKLIEVGTRLDGLSVPSVNNAAVGFGPVDLVADLICDEQNYREKTRNHYPLKKHARTVYLTSYREDEVKAVPGEKKLKGLGSFHQMRLRVRPGDKTVKTINYFTAPGFVTLVHEDPEVVERDYRQIRQWEQANELITYV